MTIDTFQIGGRNEPPPDEEEAPVDLLAAVQELLAGLDGFDSGPSPRGLNVDPFSATTYSNVRRDQFREVRNVTKELFGLSSVADLDSRVNAIAEQFRSERGHWPQAFELLNYPPYIQSLEVMRSGTWAVLPPLFGMTDEAGETQFFQNNTISGPRVINPSFSRVLQGDFPVLSNAQVQGLLENFQAIKQPSAGSGRSGAAGRAKIVFDKAELTEGATERWRGMLLETPEDSDIASLVSDYTTDANAFWMKEGGRRDFDTFVVDRIRGQSRYNYLYSKKPGFQSETEYLGGFRQVAGGLGLNASATLREVEAGASTGVGLAGFGERLSGIREVRTANAGAFSQRIAASAGQMGLTRT